MNLKGGLGRQGPLDPLVPLQQHFEAHKTQELHESRQLIHESRAANWFSNDVISVAESFKQKDENDSKNANFSMDEVRQKFCLVDQFENFEPLCGFEDSRFLVCQALVKEEQKKSHFLIEKFQINLFLLQFIQLTMYT